MMDMCYADAEALVVTLLNDRKRIHGLSLPQEDQIAACLNTLRMKSPEAIRLLNHVKSKTKKNLKEYGLIYPQLFQNIHYYERRNAPIVPSYIIEGASSTPAGFISPKMPDRSMQIISNNAVIRGGSKSESIGRDDFQTPRSISDRSLPINNTYNNRGGVTSSKMDRWTHSGDHHAMRGKNSSSYGPESTDRGGLHSRQSSCDRSLPLSMARNNNQARVTSSSGDQVPSSSSCKNCGEAHLSKFCESLKCNICEGVFGTVSLREKHYRKVHRRQQDQIRMSAKAEQASQSKANMNMGMGMDSVAVVLSGVSSQQMVPSSSDLVPQQTGLVPHDDQGVFCQNCLGRGHVWVDCPMMECGICFEVFSSAARRVAHSFLQHRDSVVVDMSADYCRLVSPLEQQQQQQLISDSKAAVVSSGGDDTRLPPPPQSSSSSSSSAVAAGSGSKRSRSPEYRDDDGGDGGDGGDRSRRIDSSSKRLKALELSELEEIVTAQGEQMIQMRDDMKAQRQQVERLQWDIKQHQQEMQQDREGTHAQRQVMKQQQDMINRQQEESQQILRAFQEDADKITRRLLDVLYHRMGSGFVDR